MKKLLLLILVQFVFSTIIYAGGIVPPRQDPDNPEWVKGEILVKFKDDVELQISSNRGILETGINSLNELNSKWQVTDMEKVFKTEKKRTETKTIRTYTGEIIEVPQLFNIYKMKIPDDTDVEKAVEDFEENPNVEYAEPNYIARICVIPDDPGFSNQWGLHNTGQYYLADADIDAPEAWEIETGDSTVVIAIIDTGVDYGHPDLADKMVSTGYDFVNDDDDAMDDNGHGTHVAGIAAATTNNATGIAGVAWNCKILPVKVLQSNGYGTYSDVASGVNYAANNNAKVINLSLGGYSASSVLHDALENAYTTSVIVAAAGNHIPPLDIPFYPAAWSFVIGVGASDVIYDQITQTWYEGRAVFSNYGINADIYAPGVNIYSTIPLFHPHTYSYASWNGTSMAAPFVTGTVALLHSHYSDWSNELIHGQLINTTDPIFDLEYGVTRYRLNANSALIEIVEPQLNLYSHTIIDTLPGCDQDGIADAGETVEMVFDIQNTWGQAYNVEATLSYHSYEDTCFVTIIDSIATFGAGVSPYAHVNNETNPFKFYVKSSTPNNTDVYFDYEITCDGEYSFTGTYYITAQRGIEIGGIIAENTTWSNHYLYIVTANTLVDEGITLTIEPGTRIQFNDYYLRIDGCLVAIGTEDSMIVFTSNAQNPAPGDWVGIKFYDPSADAVFDVNGNYVSGSIIKYAEVEFTGPGIDIGNSSPYIAFNLIHDNNSFSNYGGGIRLSNSSSLVEYNSIRNNYSFQGGGMYISSFVGEISDNNIEDNSAHSGGGIFIPSLPSTGIITMNIIRGNYANGEGGGIATWGGSDESGLINYNTISCNHSNANTAIHSEGGKFENNTIINNTGDSGIYMGRGTLNYNNIINNREYSQSVEVNSGSRQDINAINNYWGTTNPDSIDTWIWDYYDDFDNGIVFYQPFATSPIVDAPGFLYQVEFNPPPPIGCEVDTFNLIFSKPMDISIQPYVTFGVCDPWTQNIIVGDWSDSTHWQGTYEFNIMTGDGINNLRVTTAKDCEGMEIPKDTRFSFVVDATGASSLDFIAQAGNEEVYLSWREPEMVDLMGYNMYRYHEITDTTYSDTTLVNTSMITDTTYCDTSVTPYTTYFYMFTCISTDFQESDYSDPASAIPFNFHTDFEADTVVGLQPLNVQFIDLSIGILPAELRNNKKRGYLKTIVSKDSREIIAWEWDFDNDGTIDSNEQNPLFTYTEVGLYTVTLTVSDGINSGSETKVDYITVGEPIVADFEAEPLIGLAPLEVQFTDLSIGGLEDTFNKIISTNRKSAEKLRENVIAKDDSRDIVSWEWDFDNDGTIDSNDQNPLFTYTEVGLYTVTITVSDGVNSGSETKVDYITVGEPIVADFEAEPLIGLAPLEVQFTDLSIGGLEILLGDAMSTNKQLKGHNKKKIDQDNSRDIISWEWDFDGDGTIDSNEQNPLFTYAEAGSFTVTLTVSDGVNSGTETKVDYITVGEPIVADFEAEPLIGLAPLEVQFTDLSIGGLEILLGDAMSTNKQLKGHNKKKLDQDNSRDIISWEWDFDGDGTIDSNEQNPLFTYTEAGLYTVVLTVGDGTFTDSETKVDYISVSLTSTEIEIIPLKTMLIGSYPNPFNPSTTIRYDLKETANVKIQVFNIKGQIVTTLVNQNKEAGYHSVEWEGKDSSRNPVSSGLYLYKLIVENKSIDMKKCLLLK